MINIIGALWLMIGLVVVIVMLVLSLVKKAKWKTIGKTVLYYIGGLVILIGISVSMPQKKSDNKAASSSSRTSHVQKHKHKSSSSSSSSSSSASSSSSQAESAESVSKPGNAFTASLQKSVDNWNSGDNSINVKKAWYKDHTAFIAVDIDDWGSLSTSEQQNFADNWLQSVQGLYRMSGKKGGTNVMIVDNDNHDHMLAHTRSLHDTMKLDN